MDVIHRRCAGLDVHKDTVVACARIQERSRVRRVVETFATTTSGLLALLDFLKAQRCTQAAMEASGVYWKPVWHVLEGHVELLLANAKHVRNLPGRKTDVNDATWIADLLAHGLIRASFVPPEPVQQLRDLTRTRRQMVRQITRHIQRIQKTLEDANIKITGLVTDLLGASGRAILKALAAGEHDPERLAALLRGSLVLKRDAVIEGLRGRITGHHRFLLSVHLAQIEALELGCREIENRIAEVLEPFRLHAKLLTTIPGVSQIAAQTLIAEIGADMSRFPTARHLISWAGLCPKNDESAGKRRSTRLRPGAPWLKPVLVQAAWAASQKKDSYLRSQFLRLRGRRGAKKANIAVAASILTAAYHILRDRVAYQDLGPAYFERRDKIHIVNRLLKRMSALGFHVELRPAA